MLPALSGWTRIRRKILPAENIYANIDLNGVGASHTLELFFLQDAKKHDLGLWRNIKVWIKDDWRTTVTVTPDKRNDKTQGSLCVRASPKNYYK